MAFAENNIRTQVIYIQQWNTTETQTAQIFNFFFWCTLISTCSLALCGLHGCKNRPALVLAGCHTRRLNQALSVLSLSLGFYWCMYLVLLTRDSFYAVMCVICVFCVLVIMPCHQRAEALSDDALLTSVRLCRTSGLSREQRGLGRLKLAQR